MVVWAKQLGLRWLIRALQLVQKLVATSRFQRIVGRPVAYGVVAWVAWRLIRNPRATAEATGPEVVGALESLQASLDAPVKFGDLERARAVGQAMTWGVAGAAILLLTATVASGAHRSWELELAASCFAPVIPILVICGTVYLSYTDAKAPAPTARHCFSLNAIMHGSHLVLCVGIAALLWSYQPLVAVVFVVGCWLSWRYLGKAGRTRAG